MICRALRFAWVVILAAAAVSCLGRTVSDFDLPDDPHDAIRGAGVWLVAVLVATLDTLALGRRTRSR